MVELVEVHADGSEEPLPSFVDLSLLEELLCEARGAGERVTADFCKTIYSLSSRKSALLTFKPSSRLLSAPATLPLTLQGKPLFVNGNSTISLPLGTNTLIQSSPVTEEMEDDATISSRSKRRIDATQSSDEALVAQERHMPKLPMNSKRRGEEMEPHDDAIGMKRLKRFVPAKGQHTEIGFTSPSLNRARLRKRPANEIENIADNVQDLFQQLQIKVSKPRIAA